MAGFANNYKCAKRSITDYFVEWTEECGNVIGSVSNFNLLNCSIKIGYGKNRSDKRWPSRECTFGNLFHSLAKHKESATKDGPAFLQGEAEGGQRLAKSMSRLWLAGIDVDCADALEAVLERVFAVNVCAFVYTTFSHMGTSTDVSESAYTQWAKKAPELRPATPTPESIGNYLCERGKLSPTLAKTVTACPRAFPQDGVVHRVAHDPAPRFRIIFPLAQSFEFLKDGTTQAERITEWKLRLYALADLVGVVMDESCVDPSRLFYLPTHAPSRSFETYAIMGDELLDCSSSDNLRPLRHFEKGGSGSSRVKV